MLIQKDKRKQREAVKNAAFRDEMYREALHKMRKENYDYDHGGKQRLAEYNRKHGGGHIEGLGQHEADYDATQWFRARQKDKHFWEDPNNVKQYQKDNPEVLKRR